MRASPRPRFELSAGRAAMWVIALGIVLGTLLTLALRGISHFPFEWWGLLGAAVLALVAFVLGLVD